MSGPRRWYLPGIGTENIGPLSGEEVNARLRQGEIPPDTLCWRRGMPEWRPLSEIVEFAVCLDRVARERRRRFSLRIVSIVVAVILLVLWIVVLQRVGPGLAARFRGRVQTPAQAAAKEAVQGQTPAVDTRGDPAMPAPPAAIGLPPIAPPPGAAVAPLAVPGAGTGAAGADAPEDDALKGEARELYARLAKDLGDEAAIARLREIEPSIRGEAERRRCRRVLALWRLQGDTAAESWDGLKRLMIEAEYARGDDTTRDAAKARLRLLLEDGGAPTPPEPVAGAPAPGGEGKTEKSGKAGGGEGGIPKS